jgi:DNA mismatch endonuclease (patch repair protein)
MSLVRGKDTGPELIVRRLVHGLGYRYRLHRRDLPGKPDLVFPSRRAVILVHGCFWHQHPDPGCKLARQPKSRIDFWGPKLRANHIRDVRNLDELTALGWRVLTVWECELGDRERLRERVVAFLGNTAGQCAESNSSREREDLASA